MEEKDINKNQEIIPELGNLETKKPEAEADELKNEKDYNQLQKENIQSNDGKNDETENKPKPISLAPNPKESNNNIESGKRHRIKQNEINDKSYQCPECHKCYLSGPALTTHRKAKHGYENNGEKKMRGRPKKDGQNENGQANQENKFIYFFKDENRKPNCLDKTLNNNTITLDIIKEYFEKIFNQCKLKIFENIPDVKSHTFYPLITENWEKEKPFSEKEPECFRAINSIEAPLVKLQSYNLDQLFFLYLKEFSDKTNKDYFWFMFKYIILFRECINNLRKNLIKAEYQNKSYSQIYNAETVPEICNDFFLEFMEPYDYFGMNKDELIELVQHFCYWLYYKRFTKSHLTLLDNEAS